MYSWKSLTLSPELPKNFLTYSYFICSWMPWNLSFCYIYSTGQFTPKMKANAEPGEIYFPRTGWIKTSQGTGCSWLRDCSEFLIRVGGGVVLFGKSARKKHIPPLGITVKFWYPPSESQSNMGLPPPGNLVRNGYPQQAKVPPPPPTLMRNSEQSLTSCAGRSIYATM